MREILIFGGQLFALVIFLFSSVMVAFVIGNKVLPRESIGVRWCAVAIVYGLILSAVFSSLMFLDQFLVCPAIVIFSSLYILLFFLFPSCCRDGAQQIINDLRRGISLLIYRKGDIPRFVIQFVFLTLFFLLAVRVLMLPLLGWDSLTYHGLKAGLWVQGGGWAVLEAPGGWEYYRTFFGGGEIFTAWAMLFPRSDMLAGIPDLAFWMLIGLVVVCLAREFGSSRRSAIFIAVSFVCSWEFSKLVGTGYVDTCSLFFLLAGVLFLFRSLRVRQLSFLYFSAGAFGLAAATKVNLLVVSIPLMAVTVAFLFYRYTCSIKKFAFLLVVYAAPVLPWLIQNYFSSGYVLGCVPLSIGSLVLGEAPPNLEWFLDREDLMPYHLGAESEAFLIAVKDFGGALVLAVIGIAFWLYRVLKRESQSLIALVVIGMVMILYLSPSFSVIRLGWAGVNGRFLAPGVILATIAGLPLVVSDVWWRKTALEILCVGCAAFGVVVYINSVIWGSANENEVVFLAISTLLSIISIRISSSVQRKCLMLNHPILVCFILSLVLGSTIFFSSVKNSLRSQAYSTSTIMRSFPRYWTEAFDATEQEKAPMVIAFNYAPLKISHFAFLSPFIGSNLDNRLVYVSPERDGSIKPHHPEHMADSDPDFKVWRTSLDEAHATHVLGLLPPSIEVRWMCEHADQFTQIAGKGANWGLFRIKQKVKEGRIEK